MASGMGTEMGIIGAGFIGRAALLDAASLAAAFAAARHRGSARLLAELTTHV